MNLSYPNVFGAKDPWDIESDTGGIKQARARGQLASDVIAAGKINPLNSVLNTGAKTYNPPAAYMGVWATKKEMPGGLESALPPQNFTPYPWLLQKVIPPHFIPTG